MERALWTPDSWRAKPNPQVLAYRRRRRGERRAAARRLSAAGFCRRGAQAQTRVEQGGGGRGVPAAGGDCAESFAEHSADNIRDFFRVFLQMAVVLTFAGSSPVVKIGRIAGSSPSRARLRAEKVGDTELPSYRGDIVNDIDFTTSPAPRPARQLTPTGSRPRR
jgi:3-deoxy-7-phosphoheptulonate synthase